MEERMEERAEKRIGEQRKRHGCCHGHGGSDCGKGGEGKGHCHGKRNGGGCEHGHGTGEGNESGGGKGHCHGKRNEGGCGHGHGAGEKDKGSCSQEGEAADSPAAEA